MAKLTSTQVRYAEGRINDLMRAWIEANSQPVPECKEYSDAEKWALVQAGKAIPKDVPDRWNWRDCFTFPPTKEMKAEQAAFNKVQEYNNKVQDQARAKRQQALDILHLSGDGGDVMEKITKLFKE